MQQYWALAPDRRADPIWLVDLGTSQIAFDTPAARAIRAHLETGPAQLSAIAGFAAGDVLESLDALFVSGQVFPVNAPRPSPAAQRVNQWIEENDFPIQAEATGYGAIAG